MRLPHLFRKSITPAIAAALLVLSAAPGCATENHQPSIAPIGEQTIRVGEELELVVLVGDDDGDPLELTATPMPVSARWEKNDLGEDVFIWGPLVSETSPTGLTQLIRFTVTDGKGGKADRLVKFEILPQEGIGAPIFSGPQGYVLNLSEDSDLAFVVTVKDDDSADVALNATQGIPGAKFQKLDAKSASFYWKPTEEQRKSGNYWQLVVSAEDGVHPPVSTEISILLMNADAGKDCAGSAPVLKHTPLGDLKQAGALAFRVDGVDSESALREVIVHYATNNPLDPSAYENHTIELASCDPSLDVGCPQEQKDRYFIGLVASPAANATEPQFFHYFITGVDNDDVKGTLCDQVTRLPKAGHYTTALYPKGYTGGCKDDAREPNDNLDTASLLDAGLTWDLRLCGDSGATDWFRIDVTPGTVLSVEAEHDPQHGALALSMHDGAGTQIYPPPGNPPIEYAVLTPSFSPVFAKVYVPEGQKVEDQTYNLVVTRTQGNCPNDSREPNELPDQAVLVGSGDHEVVICPGDRDWLKVSAGPTESIVLDLSFQHGFGDLDLRLYDNGGENVLAVSETATNDERIVYSSTKDDTYYIEMRGYQGQLNSADLDIQVVPTVNLCVEDYFSPNHGAAVSTLLPENIYYNLFICAQKEDWYRIDVNAGETLTVFGIPAFVDAGALDVAAFSDEEGKVIIGSAQAGPEPDIVAWTATRPDAGPLRFRIRTPGQATVPYNLAFGVQDAPGPCEDDRFTPTGTSDTALQVSSGLDFVTRLKICPGGEDWFRFDGKALQTLFVYVFGFPNEAPLAAELYRLEDGEPGEQVLAKVVDGISTSNGVEIKHLPDDNGDFLVRVIGAPGEIHHYDLVLGSE